MKTWQGVVRGGGGASIFLLDPAFPPAAFVFVGHSTSGSSVSLTASEHAAWVLAQPQEALRASAECRKPSALLFVLMLVLE